MDERDAIALDAAAGELVVVVSLLPPLPLPFPLPPPTAEDEEVDAEATIEEVGATAEDSALLELETAAQERSYKGVVLKLLPTIPKLGLGVTGLESCWVNHQVLTFPKRGHPTSSQ